MSLIAEQYSSKWKKSIGTSSHTLRQTYKKTEKDSAMNQKHQEPHGSYLFKGRRCWFMEDQEAERCQRI